jgi:hypothetical protein
MRSFPKHGTMNANGILDFIHNNICGPFKIKFGVSLNTSLSLTIIIQGKLGYIF